MQADIRKWFMKQHDNDKDNRNAPKPALSIPGKFPTAKDASTSTPVKSVQGGPESSGRRKTSKYFASEKQNQEDAKEAWGPTSKRKVEKSSADLQPPHVKKLHTADVYDDGEDFVLGESSAETTPGKKLKSGSGKGIPSNKEGDVMDVTPANAKSSRRGRGGTGGAAGGRGKRLENDEGGDDEDTKEVKSAGRGRGGRCGSAAGSGGGRGGFMPFGERKEPPHKGQKEVPEGSPECLSGSTFVISGTLDSLEREEAEDLIK